MGAMKPDRRIMLQRTLIRLNAQLNAQGIAVQPIPQWIEHMVRFRNGNKIYQPTIGKGSAE